MLSSVINIERAIQVNILIMRTFTKLRTIINTHDDLRIKFENMERKYDKNFKVIFKAIKQLIDNKIEPKRKIGFQQKNK